MKKYLILIVFFFIAITVQSQEIDINNTLEGVTENLLPEDTDDAIKEAMKASGSLINFYNKYDDKGASGEVDQEDFDKMLNEMNWSISDDTNNGLTKEDAFKFINIYIKSDKGETIQIDEQKKDEVANFLNDIDKGKSDAEALFNEATTDDKMQQMMINAKQELYNSGIRENSIWYTYDEYKALIKKEYPKANEGQIKAAYHYFIDQIKKGMGE